MSAVHHPLWHSISFRLAFWYGLLAIGTMLIALTIVYLQTVGVLQYRVERRVGMVAQKLQGRYREKGTNAVISAIDDALADDRDSDEEFYLLVGPDGRKLAGNLDDPQLSATWAGESALRRFRQGGRMITAHMVVHELDDGGSLVVGHDWHELNVIKALAIRASAVAGVFAICVLAVTAFLFRLTLERSVATIRRTTARVAVGELQERIALPHAKDEFALLQNDINAMLDRIQVLVDGIRHVSNTIAHDLRAPLARVIGHLRAAQDPASLPGTQQLAIEAATEGAKELAKMFAKLLQIADVEAGGGRRTFEVVALHELADDVTEMYAAAAQERGAVLQRAPADVCFVWGDRELLAGALANLLDNALKHGGAQVVVRIGTRAEGRWVQLSVQDNGPGVPAAELSRIGTRFHRFACVTAGYGLGLASVRAIAAAHEGLLTFTDVAPGLAVHLELPAYGG